MRTETDRISVARDFSPQLGWRYPNEGRWSGEEFRENVLLPALRRAMNARDGRLIEIDFDGVRPPIFSSFLEEAFGGAVRALKRPIGKLFRLVGEEHPVAHRSIERHVKRAEAQL